MHDSGLFRSSHSEYITVGGDDSPPQYQSLLGGHSPPSHHLGAATYVDHVEHAVDDLADKYHDDDGLLHHHHHHQQQQHHNHHGDPGGPGGPGGAKDVDLGVAGAPTTTTTIGGFNVINRPGAASGLGAVKDQGLIKVEPDMSQSFNLLPPFMSD
ncbi:Vacuolar membrane protease [Frankliniella fusca]|uniref:Vacuolar membrane protease n=1 Tax=Frankliniella fusca TaxID=407009 RepID=A0AAE1I4I5_9NEOP|nr:Vacuolar membrane protease [Frankliniella fusca]